MESKKNNGTSVFLASFICFFDLFWLLYILMENECVLL
ncbi:hypothetical protein CU023_1468 [Enterococcus faecium]|nr:hypothetical protein [Enterococcus faecium]